MTPIEAYNIICAVSNQEPVVMLCREYDDFYGFYLAPPGSDPEMPCFVGPMILVFKSSGEVVSADHITNLNVHRTHYQAVDLSMFSHVDTEQL